MRNILLFLLLTAWCLPHISAESKSTSINLDSFSDDAFDFEDEEIEEDSFKANDAIPGWNKACFKFNYWFLRRVVIPISKTYKKTVPEKVRGGVKNFFYNLRGPVRSVNCLLQGKVKKAEQELGRTIINSTIGILGVMDPATKKFKMKTQNEDFGQTLGKWGVGSGTYLQIPFLGPRTLRDFVTFPVNNTFTIDSYVGPTNFYVKSSINGLEIVDNTSNNLETLESIEKDALDPYTHVRDAYLQLRQAQVED